jgi:hypothetical protein
LALEENQSKIINGFRLGIGRSSEQGKTAEQNPHGRRSMLAELSPGRTQWRRRITN